MVLSLEGCLTQILIFMALYLNGLQKITQILMPRALLLVPYPIVGTRPNVMQ